MQERIYILKHGDSFSLSGTLLDQSGCFGPGPVDYGVLFFWNLDHMLEGGG
jgi:hypothetical protein